MSGERPMSKLAAKVVVGALLYVGLWCSVFAGIVFVYALVEQAWGLAGFCGIAAALGSMVCGLEATRRRRRGDEVGLKRLALLGAGSIVLMFAAAILVVLQVQPAG